ncbi:DUF4149 domain-containing protein [Uliginosibacterium sp. 31-12]|uniref:DUF4149 domain-containing protein n=1 Tax=Uliginosibacterium sp. 31-12 TaxID=3062781 RepID=UPI0026E37482|nr:DUF4149 domain-containing protein [Uliginosibacterium sp. 31-12]MDO6386850.1 DUF4149 domain-containing protein [Uliginosibacterium sp. 31-12]
MSRLAESLFALAITLWVGALWAIGYISAPVLFASVADTGFAGSLAGKQFAIVAWLGIGCGLYLIAYLLFREGLKAFKGVLLWLILLMLLLTLAGHFGVTPVVEKLRLDPAREVVESVVRSRFATWHGIASLLWMIQSVLGVALVTQVVRK